MKDEPKRGTGGAAEFKVILHPLLIVVRSVKAEIISDLLRRNFYLYQRVSLFTC